MAVLVTEHTVSSPKPFKSLSELREWHASQVEHYKGLAMIHHAFAVTPVAEESRLAKTYLEREKHYLKMAEMHNSAVGLLRGPD